MKWVHELPDESGRIEVVARAIFAHRNYPGRRPVEVPWPPERKSTLVSTWNLAASVVRALDEHEAAAK